MLFWTGIVALRAIWFSAGLCRDPAVFLEQESGSVIEVSSEPFHPRRWTDFRRPASPIPQEVLMQPMHNIPARGEIEL